MEFTLGQNLNQCIKAFSNIGQQINSLADSLERILKEEIQRDANEVVRLSKLKTEFKDNHDESAWVYTDHARSIPLIGSERRKNKRPEQYLSFQISLHGNGIAEKVEPLLHICLWKDKLDFEDFYMSYPMQDGDDPIELEHRRLITWGNRPEEWDWSKLSWTFSLRLFEMDSIETLHESISVPVVKLLKGISAIEALPDGLKGLVIYKDKSLRFSA